MIYVASPYSSDDPVKVLARFLSVSSFVDSMINKGFVAFSPIVYCHPIAARIDAGIDAHSWIHFNVSMLRRVEAIYILCLDGWEESVGVTLEIKIATLLNIPMVYYDPNFRLIGEEWKGILVEQF